MRIKFVGLWAFIGALLVAITSHASLMTQSSSRHMSGRLIVSNIADRVILAGAISAMQPALGPVELMKAHAVADFELSMDALPSFADGQWWLFRVRFTKVSMKLDGQSSPEKARLVMSPEPGFLVRKDKNGRIESLRFPPSWESYRINMIQRLIDALQFTHKPSKSGRWEATERGSGGDWLVAYSVRPKGHTVRKVWKELIDRGRWDSSESIVGDTRSRSGQFDIVLDNGDVVKVSGRHITTHENEVRQLTKTLVVFNARRVFQSSFKRQNPKTRRRFVETALTWPMSHIWQREPSLADRRREAHVSFSEGRRLATFQKLNAAFESVKEVGPELHELARDLTQLIYVRPQALALVSKKLKEQKTARPTTFLMATALSQSGEPQAQAVLMDVATSKLADIEFASILIDRIAHAELPDRRLMLYLMQLAGEASDDQVREAAELSLRTLVGRIKASRPAWGKEAGVWMVNRLQKAKDARSQIRALRMIGNGGPIEAFDSLLPYFQHQDSRRRAFAMDAARSLPSDDIDPYLVTGLRDNDSSVRAAAATALANRRVLKSTIEAELKTLESEPEYEVRRAVMGSLWRSRSEDSRIVEAFQRIASLDPSEDLRVKAGADLEAYRREQRSQAKKTRLPDPLE